MIGLEWLVSIVLIVVAVSSLLYYQQRNKKLVRLYFLYDETLIPYYLEQSQVRIKNSDYAGALHSFGQIMLAYEKQLEISKTRYFRRFIRKPNTFSQTYLHDLKVKSELFEMELQNQQDTNLSLLKHCRLWLMDLEKIQEIGSDKFSWKALSPEELKHSKDIKIRPEERILYVRMMLLHAKAMRLLWCWHFSLKDRENLYRGVSFMQRVFAANYACAKLLHLQELLPEYDCDYTSLQAYCKEHPLDYLQLCEGVDPEKMPCTEHFPSEQEMQGKQPQVASDGDVFYDPVALIAFNQLNKADKTQEIKKDVPASSSSLTTTSSSTLQAATTVVMTIDSATTPNGVSSQAQEASIAQMASVTAEHVDKTNNGNNSQVSNVAISANSESTAAKLAGAIKAARTDPDTKLVLESFVSPNSESARQILSKVTAPGQDFAQKSYLRSVTPAMAQPQ